MSSTDNKANTYVFFCTPLLRRPSQTQIFPSALYSENLSLRSFLNVSDQTRLLDKINHYPANVENMVSF